MPNVGGNNRRPITDLDLIQSLSTGLTSGGVVTQNVSNPNNIDIAEGTGTNVDNFSTPERVANPVITPVEWDAILDIPLTNLTLQVSSGIGMDKTGSPVQRPEEINTVELRDLINLSTVLHPDKANISGIDEQVYSTNASNLNLVDLTRTIGTLNVFGNKISSGGLLTTKKSFGSSFALGQMWKTTKQDPNFRTNDPVNAISALYTWRDGSGGFNASSSTTTDLDTDSFDDGTGGASSPNGVVPVGKWTVTRAFFAGGPNTYQSTTNNFFYQYGERYYDSKIQALLNLRENIDESTLAQSFQLRGWIIARSGATELDDDNEVLFVEAGPDGTGVAGYGGKITEHFATVGMVGTTSIAGGGWRGLAWDNPIENNDGIWDVGTPSRFTIQTDGRYKIATFNVWNGTATVEYKIRILKNGVDQLGISGNSGAANNKEFSIPPASFAGLLLKDDYIEIQVEHDSGPNQDLLADGTVVVIEQIR